MVNTYFYAGSRYRVKERRFVEATLADGGKISLPPPTELICARVREEEGKADFWIIKGDGSGFLKVTLSLHDQVMVEAF